MVNMLITRVQTAHQMSEIYLTHEKYFIKYYIIFKINKFSLSKQISDI